MMNLMWIEPQWVGIISIIILQLFMTMFCSSLKEVMCHAFSTLLFDLCCSSTMTPLSSYESEGGNPESSFFLDGGS
eukprot:scaffold246980_cov71-Attheya_sp.AAC.1